ncbi:MAG: iron-sulfur cluster carrier protein ApbC [Pelistega sp.]|nr:iron-sulfur cluster carrier protein ApbC [Pelistega sp.]
MSVTLSPQQVLAALQSLQDPLIIETIGHKLKAEDIRISGTVVHVRLTPGYFLTETDRKALQNQALTLLHSQGVTEVHLEVVNGVQKHKVQDGLKPIETIKNIIAVASGKGGVGKSTTAVNLAVALAQSGARVGVLDADIYGPSQPLLLGVKGKPGMDSNNHMIPPQAHGVWVNSFGFLIEENQAAIWRGPMVVQAMNQLLSLTAWPDLDYLIVDMPPGTGDIALSLAQKVPVVGAVIVTTPQDIALLDVRKGASMFQTVHVPILGVVENMSVHICSNCGHAEHIFGTDGGKHLAEKLDVSYLGGLPLALSVREQSDSGIPIVAKAPDSEISLIYQQMARKLMLNVSNLPKDMAHKFPPIVVKR